MRVNATDESKKKRSISSQSFETRRERGRMIKRTKRNNSNHQPTHIIYQHQR
jgi:hypothetical protein